MFNVSFSSHYGKVALNPNEKIENMTCGFNLPDKIAVSDDAISGIALDKKASGKDISIILIEKIGQYKIHKMKTEEYAELLKKVL